MPDIFRGIHLDPLVPANSFYLLWMILGYLVVTSVLIVSLGRLGDMVGRVRIFNLGFVIYTVASLLLAIDWLIIWLQGIWLPQHGCNFTETPLWAGIYMLPLTVGLLGAGPVSGYLSDRFGARPFATAGMLLTAVGFGLLLLLPTDFSTSPSA